MLTVHHLGISQSERIVWLCEELGIEYKLQKHTRAPVLAPESLKIPGNHLGKAPFIEDDGVQLSESGAICDYIIAKYGGGKSSLQPKLGDKNYVDYLYWYHYSNATLQASLSTTMFIGLAGLPADNQVVALSQKRVESVLKHVDDNLASKKWLAGDELTAADVMTVYCISTGRYFGAFSLKPYANILRYLKDVGERPAYQRAMEKGDPEMELLLMAEAPEKSLIAAGGTQSDIWKKASLRQKSSI